MYNSEVIEKFVFGKFRSDYNNENICYLNILLYIY